MSEQPRARNGDSGKLPHELSVSRPVGVLYGLVQRYRRLVAIGAYTFVTVVGFAGAFLLRFEFAVPAAQWDAFFLTLPLLVLIRLATSRVFRLSTGRWRFVGTDDVVRLVGATLSGTALFWGLLAVLPFLPSVPRSVLLLEWVLTSSATAGVWLSYRILYERLRRMEQDRNGPSKRTLIVGAGEAGNLLAREILRFPTGYRLVGFVDDDPFKWGTTLHGVEVIGGTADIGAIAGKLRAEEIIIAVPSAPPEELRRIVAHCEDVDAPFKVLPGIAEVLKGEVDLRQIRPLEINDLLGREPVSLKLPALRASLEGRTVLITGGAGSIGAELARQVAANDPARLILLDQAESDLYFIELELKRTHPDLDLVCVVGDILDPGCLERVFGEYRPHRVFHAAAYKHVPLMETNVREAVRNNVLGTWRTAKAAADTGCESFLLISTDKAVEPSSVMGATKRAAERIVMACVGRYPDTSFVAVRFGNVLNSNGSVIPLFKRQLENGEPLTVTHPEVTRYFMTISEAVQLVLQASTLDAAQGRIAMLEMGEPVKIVELARNMIRLSGLREGIDAKIEFTELRPGEKLHEVLSGENERSTATAVEKVRIVEGNGAGVRSAEVFDVLERLESPLPGAAVGDAFRTVLTELVEGEGTLAS